MITAEDIISEIEFKAVRSSGSGGQHVNKVSSKIELRFQLENSTLISEKQKEILLQTISERLTKDNCIVLQCDETRSQHRNKDLAIQRLLDILNRGLVKPKRRRRTKVPKKAKVKRLKKKKILSDKKTARKKPDLD